MLGLIELGNEFVKWSDTGNVILNTIDVRVRASARGIGYLSEDEDVDEETDSFLTKAYKWMGKHLLSLRK